MPTHGRYPSLLNTVNAHHATTPLMAAASSGYQHAVLKLMDYGADTKITNSAGQNAVWIAAQNGQHEVLKILATCPITSNDVRLRAWSRMAANCPCHVPL